VRRLQAAVAGWRGWRSGRLRVACTVVLAAVIGVIVFDPDPGTGPGLPPWLEFTANIVMFSPVGAVAWWWRRSVPRNVAAGLVCTVIIESVQGLLLPLRVADPRDVVANTAGALIGSLLCWWIARSAPTITRTTQ
jgi:glycopeptide antibiotics resistance protein